MLKTFFQENKMGSLEEEKLAEMVREFIESESTTTLVVLPISQNPIPLSLNSTFLSLQEILGGVMDCEREVNGKILKYLKDMERELIEFENVNLNMKKKWIVLRLKMDEYEACLCKSSWVSVFGPPFTHFSAFAPPSGEYEYIDVMMKDGKNGGEETRLIIDMDFRSQFDIVRPTESYTQLKNALPAIFVGTEGKLISIINLVCSAAKLSLTERGLHIPPWRKVGFMKSKWLSQNCKKFSVSSMV